MKFWTTFLLFANYCQASFQEVSWLFFKFLTASSEYRCSFVGTPASYWGAHGPGDWLECPSFFFWWYFLHANADDTWTGTNISGQGWVAGCCEHVDEPSGFKQCEEIWLAEELLDSPGRICSVEWKCREVMSSSHMTFFIPKEVYIMVSEWRVLLLQE